MLLLIETYSVYAARFSSLSLLILSFVEDLRSLISLFNSYLTALISLLILSSSLFFVVVLVLEERDAILSFAFAFISASFFFSSSFNAFIAPLT